VIQRKSLKTTWELGRRRARWHLFESSPRAALPADTGGPGRVLKRDKLPSGCLVIYVAFAEAGHGCR
jgi:hypothetical protein